MANNQPYETIDLTESFTLTAHFCASNFPIDLDTSVNEHINLERLNNESIIILEPSPIKRPKRKYTSSSSTLQKKNKGFGDCPICWDELGTNPLASTKCGHVFCMKCLERSLKLEKKCPTCRKVLKTNSAYHPLYLGF